MFTSVGDDLIYLDFNNGVKVKIFGKDEFYLVELMEYKKNQQHPVFVESYVISERNLCRRNEFVCSIAFHFDFEVNVYKFVEDIGIVKIFTHRYNDAGKLVNFDLDTDNKEEAELWYERILEYQKKHLCKVNVKSYFEDLEKHNNVNYKNKNLNYYKTYHIGRFPKATLDFKTNDSRTEGFLFFGYWKKMWSYTHPRNWKYLTSQEIIDDILGL